MASPETEESIEEAAIPDLTGVTGFSYDDVSYNGIGQLSPAQRAQLRKVSLNDFAHLAIGVGFVAFGFAIGGRIIPAIAAIFVVFMAVKAALDARAYRAGEVLHQDGDARTEFDPGDESPDRWFVHIGGWKLEITEQAYQALVPGGPYRIFYVAGSNRAVGGHVLPGWGPLAPPEPEKKKWWGGLSIEIG